MPNSMAQLRKRNRKQRYRIKCLTSVIQQQANTIGIQESVLGVQRDHVKHQDEIIKSLQSPVAKPPQVVNEPILEENPSRHVLFPIKYHEV